MPRRDARLPWWVLLAGASFLAYFSLLIYCEVRRPLSPGLATDFSTRRIVRVTPGSPADVAGIRPGDRLLDFDGRPIRSLLEWRVTEANFAAGTAVNVGVERGGVRHDVALRLDWAPRNYLRQLFALWIARSVQAVTLVLAGVVAWRRPEDRLARLGAAFLGSVGVFSVVLPSRFASVWHALPYPVGAILWLPFVASMGGAFLFFVFCALFPRANPVPVALRVLVLAPVAILLGWHAWFGVVLVYAPDAAGTLPDLSSLLIAAAGVYALGGIILLAVKYRRLEDVNERRRVRVLLVGSIVGLASGLPLVIGQWFHLRVTHDGAFTAAPAPAMAMLLFLAFPLSFAYATLRHRMFDLSLMIRHGLQYTLARRLLLALVPALVAVMVIDGATQAGRTVGDLVRAHGLVYTVLVATIVTASFRRERWLTALDRRFFRDRYNAEQILRRLADEIRASADLRRAARSAVEQIHAALHPEFVDILVRQPADAVYAPLAASAEDGPRISLPAESKLVGMLRVLDAPIELPRDDTGWLRQLPPEERTGLQQSRIDLVVPIALAASRPQALLVLGPKRSEEPYSAEDQDLLRAIAGSLALLLEQSSVASESATATFDECPRCGACYDSGSDVCANEGSPLTAVAAPRLLGDRYRIDRRIGSGGMGTVYAGVDQLLDRAVAAKLIRDELQPSRATAERFRREAKMAAGFTHAHVVTIYDFGITSEGRPFLIMERVDGPTLRVELQRCGRLPLDRTEQLLHGICAAVQAAHDHRLVHCDLKPENVLLATEGSNFAKVVDFGIARALPTASASSLTAQTAAVLAGTLPYMAPEQLRCEEISPSWDIWALSVIAHEMVMGSHPFGPFVAAAWPPADTALGYQAALRHRFEAVDVKWSTFFARALALDPNDRPRTPSAFLSEFERALAG